jgi:nitroimidazol reductase NimA-like FMN-containing flavoprotein (pyridoxamine 5'-phosphate oxidase superfamily)
MPARRDRLVQTPRTTLKRRRARGAFDRATADAILDEGIVCHLGFAVDGQPFVIPTLYGRDGDRLLIHGSAASRALGELGSGVEACVTVTLTDGIVLARSAFHHSINYRSVVLLGTASPVEDPDGKLDAVRLFAERVVPGRWDDVRPPTGEELRATSVLEMPIREGSAKVRSGPPLDDAEDLELACWAGVIPLVTRPGPAEPAPDLAPGVEVPAYVEAYRRPGAAG